MADIFISYTSSDRAWAFWIAKELEALGHKPHVHEWEIRAGEDIYAWMEHRHDAADHVLCVFSDDYLRAPYSTLERKAALWQAAAKRPGFVLCVAVSTCQFPTLSDHFLRCELFGMAPDDARVRFREFMQRGKAPDSVLFPGKAFAVSNVPIRVPPHFMGRDDALEAVDKALRRYQGRVTITALHGLPGVGKTMLAAAYVEFHRADFRATWWIRAQTEATMRADMVSLGVRLRWVAADAKEEPALADVLERLRHDSDGVMLIYDKAVDANTLKPYLPVSGSARVLITSSAHDLRGIAEVVEIRLWPKEIGANYLLARTGRDVERIAAEALSDTLGGLPLAHEEAAAYCDDIGIGLAEYRRRFETASASVLDHQDDTPSDDDSENAAEHRDRITVAGTFRLAIEQAIKRDPAAEPLIAALAVLPPEPIPLFLLTEAREKLTSPLPALIQGAGLDKGIAALRAFALIERETIVDERDPAVATDCIRIHRLVRQVALRRRNPEAQQAIRRAWIEALRHVYPLDSWRDAPAWPRLRRLDPITVALVDPETLPPGSEENAVALLRIAGVYREDLLASYAAARLLFERALAISNATFGSKHSYTAACHCNLASVLQHEGDFAAARPHIDSALAIYNKLLGSARRSKRSSRARPTPPTVLGDRETPLVLNELTTLLRDQEEFEGARPVAERALAMCKAAFGGDHTATAIALSNLGRLLEREGDLDGARTLFDQALEINRRELSLDHPETATSFSNYARVLRDLGAIEESESYFQQAIRTGTACLSAEHPLTQRYQSHYARLMLIAGRVTEALRTAGAALEVHERINGLNHNWTKDSARITADALSASGRTQEAAVLRARYKIEESVSLPDRSIARKA